MAVIAVILYGTLFPFTFHARPDLDSAFSVLADTVHATPHRVDVLANILLFLPLGFFWIHAMRRPGLAAVALVTVFGGVFSTCIELAQLYDQGRVSSVWDICANVAGTLAGAGLGALFRGRLPIPVVTNLRRHPYIAFLLASWLGYRLFPYVPTVDLHQYWHAVRPLVVHPHIPWVDLLRHTTIWLVLALLLDDLLELRESRWVLVVFVPLLLGVRITIYDTRLSPAEAVGGVIACLVWTTLLYRLPIRFLAVAGLFFLVVVLSALEPFQFTAATRGFGWIPFRRHLQGSVAVNVQSFLEKAFRYGSLIWLPVRAGYSLRSTVLSSTTMVFVLCSLQLFIPGRSADLTDVILLLFFSCLLRLFPTVNTAKF